MIENVMEQGCRAVDLLDTVERGELDLCCFASGYLADRVPALRAPDLPSMLSDRRQACGKLDSALGAGSAAGRPRRRLARPRLLR